MTSLSMSPHSTLDVLRGTVSKVMRLVIAGLALVIIAVVNLRSAGSPLLVSALAIGGAGLGLLALGKGRIDLGARLASAVTGAGLVAVLVLALERSSYQMDMHMALLRGPRGPGAVVLLEGGGGLYGSRRGPSSRPQHALPPSRSSPMAATSAAS